MAVAMNGGRRITTHEAQVKTASVEVKALTISGKQVTLSVFRQLQEEDLVDEETAALRGVPWGYVNYYFGDCKPDHLHVVWQKGEELRRACVWPKPPGDPWATERGKVERAREVWDLLRDEDLQVGSISQVGPQMVAGIRVRERNQIPTGRLFQHYWHQDAFSFQYETPVPKGAEAWFRWRLKARGGVPLSAEDASLADEASSARERMLSDLAERWSTRQALDERALACVRRYERLCAAWQEQYEALAALDQLFIAV